MSSLSAILLDETYYAFIIAGRREVGGLPWIGEDWLIPDKVSGAWVLWGTRMPVSAIIENIEAGASIDDIMDWFDGLDREQVRAVIEFAARSLDKPPAHAS